MSLPTRPFGLRAKPALRLSHIIATGRPRLEVSIAVTASTLPFMAPGIDSWRPGAVYGTWARFMNRSQGATSFHGNQAPPLRIR